MIFSLIEKDEKTRKSCILRNLGTTLYFLFEASNLMKCKYGDSDCIIKAIQNIIDLYATDGNKELGLVTLDPYHVDKIVMMVAGAKFDVRNTDMRGMRNFKVKKAEYVYNKHISIENCNFYYSQ